jgi:cell filamentation protein
MYDVHDDTYCYPNSFVLKNKLGLKDAARLAEFEAEISTQRATEPHPKGRLDFKHYKRIHHHLFQDVYDWAGQVRSVRISKGGNAFCYPEHIETEAAKLFAKLANEDHLRNLDKAAFARKAAHFLAELNAIHPFREGNGRTQLSFLVILADQASHPLAMDRLEPKTLLKATIESFSGDEAGLEKQIASLM